MRTTVMFVVGVVMAAAFAPPAGSRGAEINGRVVKAHDGSPLRFASVTIRKTDGTLERTATADDRGQFVLSAVTPGRYAVRASAPGYVSARARPVFVSVADRETPQSLIVRLARGGVITGKVVDGRGQPLEGIAVHALLAEHRSGREVLREAGPGRISDDRGQYRLFGLEPGDYYVAVRSAVNHVPTYYPDSTAEPARTVTVAADRGSAIDNVVMRPIRTAAINGTVIDARGQPARGIELVLAPGSGALSTLMPTTVSDNEGRFSFAGVPPGTYVVHNLPAPSRPEFGSAVVTLTDRELMVALRLTEPHHGRATIVFEGGAPDIEPRSLSILLHAVDRDQSPLARGARARALADWTIELTNIWGPHLLHLTAPEGWMVKRIDVDGDDFVSMPIDFSLARSITVTLTRRSGAISGIVVDTDNRPVPDAEVLIYSADATRWFRDVRRLRLVRADAEGRFRADALPRDTYLILASHEIAVSGGPPPPAVLEELRTVAVSQSVSEGHEYQLTLRIH